MCSSLLLTLIQHIDDNLLAYTGAVCLEIKICIWKKLVRIKWLVSMQGALISCCLLLAVQHWRMSAFTFARDDVARWYSHVGIYTRQWHVTMHTVQGCRSRG